MVERPRAGEAVETRRRDSPWVLVAGGALLHRPPREWRDALRRRLLALADVFSVVTAAALLALFGRFDQAVWSALLVPAWLILAKLYGLYDRDHRTLRHLTVDEASTLFVWALSATVATQLYLKLTPPGQLTTAAAAWLGLIGVSSALVFRSLARLLWRKLTPPERTAIIGEGPLADATVRKFELFSDIHVQLVHERERLTLDEISDDPLWLADVDRVIVASQAIDEALIRELVSFCRRGKVKLSIVPPARGMFGTAVQLNHVADLPVLEYNTWDVSRSTLSLKRVVDLAVSIAACALLWPFLVLIALAIRLDSRGPIFFIQSRAGQNGRQFRMFKFRTMVTNAEDLLDDLVRLDQLRDPMFKLANDPRVTRVGRFLRRTSLDELPQLFNVLRGQMSLVGPRPEQVELVDRYGEEHRFRLAVKPGLTGPMQVYGRGQLSFDERLAVEREYIESLSFARDMRILAMTVPAVCGGRGAY